MAKFNHAKYADNLSRVLFANGFIKLIHQSTHVEPFVHCHA
ncbi:MAG: hypothetical protein QM760_14785 [Nibricoccus sp.]